MTVASVPPVLVPLPLCSTAAWRFVLPKGTPGRGAGERAIELCRIVDAFLTEAQRASGSQDLTLPAKAKRVAAAASTLLAEVQPESTLGRATAAVLDDLDSARRSHDAAADAVLDALPAVRVQRASQLAADLCAHVLAPADVERFAAALRAGDRDALEAGLLLPRIGPTSTFRELAEAGFRAKFVVGGEALLAGVEKAEAIAAILRLLLASVRAGLASHLAVANRGEAELAKPDGRTLMELGDSLAPIEAAARRHGLLRTTA